MDTLGFFLKPNPTVQGAMKPYCVAQTVLYWAEVIGCYESALGWEDKDPIQAMVAKTLGIKLKESVTDKILPYEERESLKAEIVAYCEKLLLLQTCLLRFSPDTDAVFKGLVDQDSFKESGTVANLLDFPGLSYRTLLLLKSGVGRCEIQVKELLSCDAVTSQITERSIAYLYKLVDRRNYIFVDDWSLFGNDGEGLPVKSVVKDLVSRGVVDFTPAIHVVKGTDTKELCKWMAKKNFMMVV